MKPKKLKPFSNKGYRDEDIITLSFDTETNGLGGELLLITACDFSETHVFKGENMIHELIELMEQSPYPAVWYAHHAQYDWRYFIEYIVDSQIPCEISMRNETDIYQITLFLDGARVVMRDSLAMFPGTLKQFAECFTPEIPKLEIDIEHFDPENPEHIEYAKRDTEILRRGLPRLNALLQRHFNISLGHTTAGTAMKAWQASIPDGVYYPASDFGEREQFVREGYYGGLVFLTRTNQVNDVITFDINSSYPDKMCRYGVPSGNVIKTDNYKNGLMGIYRCIVRAPHDLIVPILPHRNERGYMRWNRGEFETVVTSSELIFAVSQGYEILEIIEGLCYEDVVFPFNDFIEHCKHLRKKYKNMPEEALAKLMQNSLYGKFGSKRERCRVFVPEYDEDYIDATPLDDGEYFWIKKEFADNLRSIPQWAVFITAHARLQLLQQVYTIGVENVIYGDTDSLTVFANVADKFDIGDEYGQWKLEKQWKIFRAIAPKVYAGQLDNGKWKGAAKGLPKKKMGQNEWAALFAGEALSVEYQSLPSLRVAMEKGLSPAQPRARRVSSINQSVNWELQNDIVRPRMAPCRLSR